MKHRRTILSRLCKRCRKASCCVEGVDVDLEVAKKITQRLIKEGSSLRQPWFWNLIKDSDFPSGWSVQTVVKKGVCIFQDKNKRCIIYKFRPIHCRDFPYEAGHLHEYIGYVCRDARNLHRKLSKQHKKKAK